MSSIPNGQPDGTGNGEVYTVSDLTHEVSMLRESVERAAARGRLDRLVAAGVVVLFIAFAAIVLVFNSRTGSSVTGLRAVQQAQQQANFTDCQQRNAGQAGTTKLATQVAAFLAALNAAELENVTVPAAVTAAREKAYQTLLSELSKDVTPAAPVNCQSFLHP